jgi:hypothetical protein
MQPSMVQWSYLMFPHSVARFNVHICTYIDSIAMSHTFLLSSRYLSQRPPSLSRTLSPRPSVILTIHLLFACCAAALPMTTPSHRCSSTPSFILSPKHPTLPRSRHPVWSPPSAYPHPPLPLFEQCHCSETLTSSSNWSI